MDGIEITVELPIELAEAVVLTRWRRRASAS